MTLFDSPSLTLYAALVVPLGGRLWVAAAIAYRFRRPQAVESPAQVARHAGPSRLDLQVVTTFALIPWVFLFALATGDLIASILPGSALSWIAVASWAVTLAWSYLSMRRAERAGRQSAEERPFDPAGGTNAAGGAGFTPALLRLPHPVALAMAIAGSIAFGLGALLPWLTFTDTLSGDISLTGIASSLDGLAVILLGAASAAVNAVAGRRPAPRPSLTRWSRRLAAAAVVVTAAEFSRVAWQIASAAPDFQAHMSVGLGLWVMNVGSVVAVIGASVMGQVRSGRD